MLMSPKSRMLVEALYELRCLLLAEPGSERKIAERLGVTPSTIHRIRAGAQDYTPSPEMIEQLLDALGYDVTVTVAKR